MARLWLFFKWPHGRLLRRDRPPRQAFGAYEPRKVFPGRSVGAVQLVPDEEQTLTDTSITQNATHTTMKFTKHLVEDENIFIYATGIVNARSPHSRDGAFTMKLKPCGFANGTRASEPNAGLTFLDSVRSTRKLWIWHGVLMAVSWSILVPLAIGSSLLRDTLRLPPGVWLTIHMSLNMFAILCMAVSLGIAVYATNANSVEGEDPNHFSDLKHRTIGLVIFLLAFMQAIIGMMRPHGPKSLQHL
jgi:hypothetical protein